MADIGATEDTNSLRWRVTIHGGTSLPQGIYSMVELDSLTCALERPSAPSLEMPATDVVEYEKAGVLRVMGPAADNDNGDAAE